MNNLQNLHVGSKLIDSVPMTRIAYNDLRGWTLPSDENGHDEGFLVEYLDGGKPNVKGYLGYVSWSPKDVFDRAYRASGSFTFGDAIYLMKLGYKMARRNWNGKNMFVYLVSGSSFKVNRPPLLGIYEGDTQIDYRPHFDMKYADNTCGVWLASHSDMYEEDWSIVQ